MARMDWLSAMLQSISGLQSGAGAGSLAGLEAKRQQEQLMTEEEYKREKEKRAFISDLLTKGTLASPGGEAIPADVLTRSFETGKIPAGYTYQPKSATSGFLPGIKYNPETGGYELTGEKVPKGASSYLLKKSRETVANERLAASLQRANRTEYNRAFNRILKSKYYGVFPNPDDYEQGTKQYNDEVARLNKFYKDVFEDMGISRTGKPPVKTTKNRLKLTPPK